MRGDVGRPLIRAEIPEELLKIASFAIPLMFVLTLIPANGDGHEAKPAAATSTPAPTATPRPPDPSPPMEPIFRNGFFLRTADRKHELRIAGSVHLDARGYFGESVAPSSFDIRRARLDLQGRVHEFVTFRIQASLEDNPYIRNAYFDIEIDPAMHVRLGQMKVPFSTEWLTLDNQVNSLERAASHPVYPFFDRGVLLWGRLAAETVTYSLGLYNGSGVDLDTPKGDTGGGKEVAARLFTQPWRHRFASPLRGVYLVAQATAASESAPTRRYETSGMSAPTYESLIWRWRTEQVIGSNGRLSDHITAEMGSRRRWGVEALLLQGPLAASFEYCDVYYDDITIFHDFVAGSQRLRREPVLTRAGGIRSAALWASWFLTGESKTLDTHGWRQPNPTRNWQPGAGGGAWEVMARLALTDTDRELFDAVRVNGFTGEQLGAPGLVPVGEGGSVTAGVLDGAWRAATATLGVNWTLNPSVRVQMEATEVWARDRDQGKGGIISGGNSNLADPTRRNRQVEREFMLGMRFIFRI